MTVTGIYQVKNPPPGTHPSQAWADRQANPSVAYPAVYEVMATPEGGSTTHRIRPAWWDLTLKVNAFMGTMAGWDKARKVWSGWINAADNPSADPGSIWPAMQADDPADAFPKVAGVVTVGNYVNVLEVKNRSARIQIFDALKAPPDITEFNPEFHPELFDEFHSLNKVGAIGYAPEGEKFYYPRLAKGGIGWLPLDILETATLPTPEDRMAEPQLIIDVSRWQNGDPPKPIDFGKMYARGVRVVKVRTGIGNWYTDPQAVRNIVAANNAGMKVGAYHVVRPDQPPTSQVDRALSIVKGIEPLLKIPWTVDAEVKVDAAGKPITTAPTAAMKTNIAVITNAFCAELKRRDGRTPEFYSNYDYVTNYMPQSRYWLIEFPLHISYYYQDVAWNYFMGKAMPTLQIEGDRIPEPYLSAWRAGVLAQPYLLWQGTDNAPGSEFGALSGNVDMSVPWRGLDYNNLYASPTPPPIPTPELSYNQKVDRLWDAHPELHGV